MWRSISAYVPGRVVSFFAARNFLASVSKVSLARYGTYHLWPLIWDENRTAIGSNPNKVPVGLRLKIRKKERYSAAQIDDAKQRSPHWAQYK